jgi:glucoamylase
VAILHTRKRAFGAPGIAPRWTQSSEGRDRDGVLGGSTVWFTVSAGVLNEAYHPTIDRPQIRDLQYLITDGESFFHDERRHLDSRSSRSRTRARCADHQHRPRGRYRLVKESDRRPASSRASSCTPAGGRPASCRLRLFALLAPHLDVGGWGNNGYVAEAAGRLL